MVSAALAGVFRSLRLYYGDVARERAMDRLYARFIRPGDLAFDIGSHVGDRISSFRRCGAVVVGVEPQPLAFRALRLIHGRDRKVTLVGAACAAEAGVVALMVNSANPTVSTASQAFTRAADGAAGWERQVWDDTISVTCTTLDGLIAEHGPPAFIKIDVEGYEAEVLAGLSVAVPALSFEFTTIQRDVAGACIARLQQLGNYRYNVALGESQCLAFDQPVEGADMLAFIAALAHDANSGDVYAILDHD